MAAERAALRCPTCEQASPGYDTRGRRWRHLDTCQYRTIVITDVPWVRCATHGVMQIAIPWADDGSRFTALFEALVIDWLREASLAAVSRRVQLSWAEVDGIMSRAVARGLARRQVEPPRRIGVDETSFQKRHEYVTVVCDLERDRVLHVADEHTEASLAGFYEQLGPAEVVALDMWRPHIAATHRFVPEADRKIAFDKFHVTRLLVHAVDLVRRAEHRALRARGQATLAGTKCWWLTNPERMDRKRRRFDPCGRVR